MIRNVEDVAIPKRKKSQASVTDMHFIAGIFSVQKSRYLQLNLELPHSKI